MLSPERLAPRFRWPFWPCAAALLLWSLLVHSAAASPPVPEHQRRPVLTQRSVLGTQHYPLSLAEAQRLALANHPNLRAAQLGLRQAEIALWEAYFGLVSLTGSLNSLQRFERSGSGAAGDGSSRSQSYQLEFRLRVPLYDGGLASAQIVKADVERLQRRLDLAIARLEVLRTVTIAYWEAKRQEILYRVEDETLRQAQETYNFTRVRLLAGATAPIDFNRAEVNLINTRDGLTRAGGQLTVANERLLAQLYSPLPSFVLADEPALAAPSITLTQAEARAQEQRPEILKAMLEVRGREQDLQLAQAGLWPALTLDAGYQWGNDTFAVQSGNPRRPLARTITDTPSSTVDLGLNLQYRFWDNGTSLRRAASARAAIAIAREQLAVGRRDALKEVREAYIALLTATERARNLEKAVAIARDNLRIMNLRYRLGVALVIELSDVQTSLSQILTNRANALVDFRIAQANLARALGAEEWLRGTIQP